MVTQRQAIDEAVAGLEKAAAALRRAHGEVACERIRGCLIQAAAAVAEDLRETAGEILAADAHGQGLSRGEPNRRRQLERGAAERLIYLGQVGRDLAALGSAEAGAALAAMEALVGDA